MKQLRHHSLNKRGKIKVNNKEIAVKLFLGGDYKFLLMAMSLYGATSDYACLWCRVHKLWRWDSPKKCPIITNSSREHFKNSRVKFFFKAIFMYQKTIIYH